MKRILIPTSAVVLLVGGYFAWNYSRSLRPGSYRGANIVLITIDTLRADHLPAYGYNKVKTPAIDRLAEQSILFEDAVAHAPLTLPSHASILTGLLPPSHGVRDNAGYVLDEQIKTLPEILKENGYKTAAFVSAFVLDSQFKLDQGFDVYSDDFTLAEARVSSTDLYRRAEETQMEVESWLQKNKDQAFFLWVHYYDPHDPYEPPKPYDQQYAGSLYDGEIAYTDKIVGRLLDALEQSGLNEKTMIVLAGDHGESLGEHNELTHSLFVYGATQHVPLMFRLPKAATHRVRETVGLIDIAPSLLDLAGMTPPDGMQGRSLIRQLDGKSTADEIQYSESLLAELHYGWSPLKSLADSEYRFIEAPRLELYDRRSDRAETNNIAQQKPEVVERFRKLLTQAGSRTTAPGKIDPETEEKLKALGYVGVTVKSTAESRKIDPKDKIEVLNTISRARQAMESKNYSQVIRTLTPLVQQEPQIIDAHYILANAHLHLSNNETALREFLTIEKLKPDHTQTLYNLGYFYHTQGNFPAAEYWYKRLLKQEPDHLFGNLNLASLYRQTGRPDQAQPYIKKIIGAYERSLATTASPQIRSRLLEKVSEIRFKTGDVQQSVKDLENATKSDPNNTEAWWKLGSLYRRAGKTQDSIACFRTAIQTNREFYPAYYSLAEAYLSTNNNLTEALQLAETANRKLPGKQSQELLAAIKAKVRR